MKKIDLARQYCLTGTPSNALHKLNRYIRDVKGLKEALIRHGYHSPVARRMVTILVEMLLDPLRRVWGRPIVISSGYRCPELNILIGGAKHSHHLLGCAADLIAGSPDDHRLLFRLIQETHELCGLEFTQLILEPGARWIHISYVPGNLRCQVIDKEKSPN